MNWRYPLTNLGQKREREKTYSPPVPTATVRDADGNVILFFAGEPHRRNKDAVENATQFCEEMNQMHRFIEENGRAILARAEELCVEEIRGLSNSVRGGIDGVVDNAMMSIAKKGGDQ